MGQLRRTVGDSAISVRPIAYGPEPDQCGDLYLPSLTGAPLVCLFHGGFWRMPYGRDQLHPMASELANAGLAVWNLGYRRIGPGGALYPATLHDVELALAHIPVLRTRYAQIHASRLLFLGHSAGGHLAVWAAAKARRHGESPSAAIGLAPILDLVAAANADLGNGAVQAFLGGAPAAVPERYATASPAALLPLGIQQWVFHGEADADVPAALSRAYVAKAVAAGDPVSLVTLPGVDHMTLIDPSSPAFHAVRQRVLAAVNVP